MPAARASFLELNVFKPVMLHNVLESAGLLADVAATRSPPFHGGQAGAERRSGSRRTWRDSLMLVTALNPHIGYDKAVKIGKTALAENITLRDAAERLGFVSGEDFDRWVRPEDMVAPGASLAGG